MKKNDSVVFEGQTVDNPGEGNCAFHAFGIGLIYIIQQEGTYGNKNMFQQWMKLDPSISGLYDAICKFDFKKQNKGLLNKLQKSLRRICYDYQMDELEKTCAKPGSNYVNLLGNSSFSLFAELYYTKECIDPGFNVFVESKVIKQEIDKLKKKNLESNQENNELIKLFLKLLYGKETVLHSINNKTRPNKDSPIISAMARVTANYFWGTHLDLDYLAQAFKVNLHSLQDGEQKQEFNDLESRHTITVNNQSNVHWTTQILIATTEKEQFNHLKNAVKEATNSYINYSKSIWFSIFHRHGESGRKRAAQFASDFKMITSFAEAKQALQSYLKDENNGNTHPHSYRTMLLKETLGSAENLKIISKNYQSRLTHLEDRLTRLEQDLGITSSGSQLN